jgi:hypothetical protein
MAESKERVDGQVSIKIPGNESPVSAPSRRRPTTPIETDVLVEPIERSRPHTPMPIEETPPLVAAHDPRAQVQFEHLHALGRPPRAPILPALQPAPQTQVQQPAQIPQIVINAGRGGTPAEPGRRLWGRATPLSLVRRMSRDESSGDGMPPLGAVDDQSGPPWRSLCFQLDRAAAIFFSQLAVLVVVAVFCMYQLINVRNPDERTFYSSTLTFILGLICPAPGSRRKHQ